MCEGVGRGKTALQVFFSESLRLMFEYELLHATIVAVVEFADGVNFLKSLCSLNVQDKIKREPQCL